MSPLSARGPMRAVSARVLLAMQFEVTVPCELKFIKNECRTLLLQNKVIMHSYIHPINDSTNEWMNEWNLIQLMYPAGSCSERWTSRVTWRGLLSFKFQLGLLGDIQLSCHWGASSYFHSNQIRLMCQVLTHCGFSGVPPDGNCAYVH